MRRKIDDVHAATGSPIAQGALERIGRLFEVERKANSLPPDQRRSLRQVEAQPILDALADYFDDALAKLSGKSDLAAAIRYGRSRWTALSRYIDDGRLEMTNNATERAIRPLTLGRKNFLFAGSDEGGERAAAIYTLVETAKVNGLDPQAYFRDLLGCIADHPINRIGELLPWNFGKQPGQMDVA